MIKENMRTKIKTFMLVLMLGTFFISGAPSISLAQIKNDAGFPEKTIIPCGNDMKAVTDSKNNTTYEVANKCTFNHAIEMVNALIDFIFKKISIPLAAIMFTYAGFKMMFSGGETGEWQKAKRIFINVALGLIIIAGSWLIIHTIADILGWTDSKWIGF